MLVLIFKGCIIQFLYFKLGISMTDTAKKKPQTINAYLKAERAKLEAESNAETNDDRWKYLIASINTLKEIELNIKLGLIKCA